MWLWYVDCHAELLKSSDRIKLMQMLQLFFLFYTYFYIIWRKASFEILPLLSESFAIR